MGQLDNKGITINSRSLNNLITQPEQTRTKKLDLKIAFLSKMK